MPIYTATITEYNGEREYSQNIFIEADDLEGANEIAEGLAKRWYPEGECLYDKDSCMWELEDGSLEWEISNLREGILAEVVYTKNDSYYVDVEFKKTERKDY